MSQAAREKHRMRKIGRVWSAFKQVEITDAIRNSAPTMKHVSNIYANTRVEVNCYNCGTPVGGVVHCVVARHGLLEHVTVAELHRVKVELFGLESTAVEIFPAGMEQLNYLSRHLWILPSDWALPFGMSDANAWGGE